MAILVEDFQDLLRALDDHPDWLEELRRRILDEQFLKLPDWVRQNSRDIQALKVSIEESRVAFEARFTTVDADIATLKADVGVLKADVGVLKADVGVLKGGMAEIRWRNNFAGRFGRVVRRARLAEPSDLDGIEDALHDGRITESEADAVRLLDLIVRGIRRTNGEREEVFLAVEISVTIDEHDITRAIDRAAILRKIGHNAVPVVAGEKMDARLRDSAVARGVEVVFGD